MHLLCVLHEEGQNWTVKVLFLLSYLQDSDSRSLNIWDAEYRKPMFCLGLSWCKKVTE